MNTWIPSVGAHCWVLPQRFAGKIIGFRLGKQDRREWQVRYLAEATGFSNEALKAENTGWFPSSKLDKRII